jgi:gluconokinase
MNATRIIVLMGPAGAGKTTVGKVLASSLGWHFLDADDFHSPPNIEKMRQGIGLTDADRKPWLDAMRAALADALVKRTPVVLACSALKEEYRRALIPDGSSEGAVRFVYLRAPPWLLRERLADRHGHYAGPELLDSQLQTLEEPGDALWVDASSDPDTIVAQIRHDLAL